MLLSPFVHREALKGQVSRRAKQLGHIAGSEHRALDLARLHAVLDQIKLDGDNSSLNSLAPSSHLLLSVNSPFQ